MKKGLSAREKVLLAILLILVVCLGYVYGFYTPITEKIRESQKELVKAEDAVFDAEVQLMKMEVMKKELNAIINGEQEAPKELPPYDNIKNVMNSLSFILADADEYNVGFSSVSKEEGIVRREITLTYVCGSYEAAKDILVQVYNGPYRCLLKDLYLSQANDKYSVTVDVTYFEYIP